MLCAIRNYIVLFKDIGKPDCLLISLPVNTFSIVSPVVTVDIVVCDLSVSPGLPGVKKDQEEEEEQRCPAP